MTEEIYIDGTLMDLDAGKTNVQMIYQSPVMMDFQSVVSNRTTNVTLPLTQSNLKAIGYVGTQAESDFPYTKHSVIYKRDGVQLLTGIATLLSIKARTITFCFTWGNVRAMESLFSTSLRELTTLLLPYCDYPSSYLNNMMLHIQYGGGRKGVGVAVKDVLAAIETQCGVTGIQALADTEDGRQYALALTGRNGDTRTRELQGIHFGGIAAVSPSNSTLYGYTVMLKGAGSTDPHNYMDSDGYIALNGAGKVRVNLKGQFRMTKRVSTSYHHDMELLGYNNDTEQLTYIDTICQGVAESSSTSVWTIRYNFDKDQIYDVSAYTHLVIVLFLDTLGGTGFEPTITDVALTNNGIIPNPDQPEEVIYGTGLPAYPVALNLPDMTCGEFIKNMLWIQAMFAYSQNGKDFQIISFNQLQANKSVARDWTEKMITLYPTERQTKLEGTAQKNFFRWAEADDYDNTQYEGVLETEDETIEQEREYCKSAFALSPTNRIPVWTLNDGEWDYNGDGQPVRILISEGGLLFLLHARYDEQLRWQWILDNRYRPYADIIRRPVVLKAEFVLTTYDLFSLDMTIPVYLRQTGHYYLIRKLTTKSGGVADAELIKI